MRYQKFNSGYSLIEVLIALLVLSVGLLGMAGLQATSLRYGQDAYSRSAATVIAYDIIERIHNNKKKAVDYIGAATCSDLSTCCSDSAATVANDLSCWAASLQKNLPGGLGSVAANAMDSSRLDITISWTDRENPDLVTARFRQTWTITP